MATHSSVLAYNPRDGGAWWAAVLGSHRVRHDWSDLAAAGIGGLSSVLDNSQLFLLYTVVVQLLSHVWFLAIPWTAACQASLSFTISQSLLKLMSTELVQPFNYLILCYLLLLLPSIFPSIRVFSNDLALCMHILYIASAILLLFLFWDSHFIYIRQLYNISYILLIVL